MQVVGRVAVDLGASGAAGRATGPAARVAGQVSSPRAGCGASCGPACAGRLYRSAAVPGAGPDLPPARRPDGLAGQPGMRAPHLAVRVDGAERSTLDVFQRGWVLLAEDERWSGAAAQAVEEQGIAVEFVRIGADARPGDPGAALSDAIGAAASSSARAAALGA
ncbi:hypothetical protein GCM10023224_32000 [Streptomonospora halophila]|uniref:Uncharacterized protein n=2 Tax=Streptomonospora halophila TaxID=427369 RepID=A0ABP9GP48_9ACTN